MRIKLLAAVATVGIIAAGGALAVSGTGAPTPPDAPAAGPAIPQVRTAKPEVPAQAPALRLPVVVEPREEALVRARVAGFLEERRVDIGDRVEAGQVLAVIDTPELVREHESLKAALAQAEAQAILAAANLRRAEALVAQGHVSRSVLDERQAQARVAAASRDATAADLARVAELLRFREVRAPFAGVVVERLVERGDLVAADQTQAGGHLFRIAGVDTLRVVVDAPQGAIRDLAPGAKLKVTFPEFPGEAFEAAVARTAGLVDRRTGTMRVEAEMANPDGRVPAGMAGHLEAKAAGTPPLQAPLAALVTRDGRPHLAVLQDGTVRYRPVTLGRSLGPKVEVVEGIGADDTLVLNPNGMLAEGQAVQVAGRN